ncbi:MAG: class II aldolase/adducin family protein [Minisyncoccia bacterium]
MYDELREKICEIGKQLVKEGLVKGHEGNISVRIPDKEQIIIKPSGFSLDKLNPHDLIIIDLDGKVISGINKPSIETPMHTLIYKSRKDVNAVIHTHPLYSICLGIMDESIKPISFIAFRTISKKIPIVPCFSPGSIELAQAVVNNLGEDGDAVLLKHHGLLTVGKDLEAAFNLSVMIEKAANIQYLCLLLGTPEIIKISSTGGEV